MKKKQVHLPFRMMMLIYAILFSACSSDHPFVCTEHDISPCTQDSSRTNLRIENISPYDFCNFEMNPWSGAVNCGSLKKGEQSCYRAFDTVYNYAWIRFYIGNKEFNMIPIDFVGEQPLGKGNFTYLIGIDDFRLGRISIKVRKE